MTGRIILSPTWVGYLVGSMPRAELFGTATRSPVSTPHHPSCPERLHVPFRPQVPTTTISLAATVCV